MTTESRALLRALLAPGGAKYLRESLRLEIRCPRCGDAAVRIVDVLGQRWLVEHHRDKKSQPQVNTDGLSPAEAGRARAEARYGNDTSGWERNRGWDFHLLPAVRSPESEADWFISAECRCTRGRDLEVIWVLDRLEEADGGGRAKVLSPF